MAIVWGLWTLHPADPTFERNPALFGPMLLLIPYQWVWGLIFLLFGIMGGWLSMIDRRKHAAFVMFILYAFMTSLFFFGELKSKAWAMYGLVTIWNFVHWRSLVFIERRGGNE